MKMPDPIWPMAYSASRRKHHHRCICCNRIISDGESVLMARVSGGGRFPKTKALHKHCADLETVNGFTCRDLLHSWAMSRLANLGYSEAKQFVNTDPIYRSGGVKEQA